MIVVRETENFKAWMQSLKERATRAIINARIKRLSGGNYGDVKPVGNGISELRINYGPGFRVYFMQRGSELIILLCGGDKATQRKDIETAKSIAANLEV